MVTVQTVLFHLLNLSTLRYFMQFLPFQYARFEILVVLSLKTYPPLSSLSSSLFLYVIAWTVSRAAHVRIWA